MSRFAEHAVVWWQGPVTGVTRSIALCGAVFDRELMLDQGRPCPLAMLPATTGMNGGDGDGHLFPRPGPACRSRGWGRLRCAGGT